MIFTLKRVANPKAPTSAGGALSQIIDFSQTKKADANTVVIKLKTPYALLDNILAEYTFGIVPEGYDPAKPSAPVPSPTSPSPGKNSVFTRYEDYWGDKAFVDQLQIQDFSDPNAQVNALLAGQVQTIEPALQPHRLRQEAGRVDPGVQVGRLGAVHHARGHQAVLGRAGAPGDAPDRGRQQMIDSALSGYGTLGNDLYAPFDRRTPRTCRSASRTSPRPSRCSGGGPGRSAGAAVHR